MNTKTLSAPFPSYGPRHRITVVIKTDGYFSVAAEIGKPGERDCDMCGRLHGEILSVFPDLAPLVSLHLSDMNGVPFHAEANGYYWLAGVVGGLGEQFHGGSGSCARTPDKCLAILAEHLRVSVTCANTIANLCAERFHEGDDLPIEHRRKASKLCFHQFVESMLPRWSEEAEAGRKQIEAIP